MQTQINCPQCRAPVMADVHQLLDVDRVPQFKQMLMAGQLNMAQCQNCGWVGQVAMPLVYHESAHDLLISFVPMELNIPYQEQEQMMGQLVRAVVENVPQEQRRAYLLQPQQIVRWQTFMEEVLATEGITKEMIAHQQKQGELVQKLSRADDDVRDYLLDQPENKKLIDEQFISMVQSMLQQAVQAGADDVSMKLTNLNVHLLTNTAVGKRFEEKQNALMGMGREAKANGMSPQLLLKYVLKHQEDDETVDMLVSASGALDYQFFAGLTATIDSAEKSKDTAKVTRLTAIRVRLLALFDQIQQASEQMVQDMVGEIDKIVAAPNKQEAIVQRANMIDEMFMQVLAREIEIARQQQDVARSAALTEVEETISGMMSQQMPPEMALVMQLLEAGDAAAINQMLDANAELVTPQLVELLDLLGNDIANAPDDIKSSYENVKTQVALRIPA